MTRRQRGIAFIITALFSFGWTGCGSAPDADAMAKEGAEDDTPLDGKFDSFTKPTDNGAFNFGAKTASRISDDERYQAWSFRLTDAAKVELRTDAAGTAPSLDTVLYLYRRPHGATSWGKYIAKNDDYGGKVWSRLAGEFDKGEYRLIIKGRKKALRGDFALEGSCDGLGCAPAPTCGAEPELVPTGRYSRACGHALRQVVTTPPQIKQTAVVTKATACNQGNVVARAVRRYDSMMRDFYTLPDNVEYTAELSVHGHWGSIVRVSLDGEDNDVSFVFDAQDRPVMQYSHDQDPVAEWYCPSGAGTEPELRCVSAAMSLVSSSWQKKSVTGTTTFANLGSGLPSFTKAAVQDFEDSIYPGGDAYTEWQIDEWSTGWGEAATLTLRTIPTVSYDLLRTAPEVTWLVFRSQDFEASLNCD
ncbi:MAG: hypothetical protein R3B13_13655 [Polyangiaceae bacterium]